MHINWYPGHMTKARRMLEESVKQVDIVIQLVDARAPLASTNPDLKAIIANKKSVFVLNKTDLADSSVTKEWLKYYNDLGHLACELNSLKKSKVLTDLITRASQDMIDKYKAKGVNKSIRVMVVGIPNVGKSTLINTISGGARAKTGDKPGVTRGAQWIRLGTALDLLDTPGILWPRIENQMLAKHLAYTGAISDNIMDLDSLIIEFIIDITKLYPNALASRYNIDGNAEPREILTAICRKRGWLILGGLDYERAAKIILDEYRGGKLGRITLERPNTTDELM